MAFFTMFVLSLSLYAGGGFPAPRSVQDTPELKCDRTTIETIDMEKTELRGKTAAGMVVYQVAADVPVVDSEGKPAGAPAALKAGQKVRIYYTVNKGAIVREIDLE